MVSEPCSGYRAYLSYLSRSEALQSWGAKSRCLFLVSPYFNLYPSIADSFIYPTMALLLVILFIFSFGGVTGHSWVEEISLVTENGTILDPPGRPRSFGK